MRDTTEPAPVSVTVPGTGDPYLAGMPAGSTASGGDTAPADSPALVARFPAPRREPDQLRNRDGERQQRPGVGPGPDGEASTRHVTGSENGISDVDRRWTRWSACSSARTSRAGPRPRRSTSPATATSRAAAGSTTSTSRPCCNRSSSSATAGPAPGRSGRSRSPPARPASTWGRCNRASGPAHGRLSYQVQVANYQQPPDRTQAHGDLDAVHQPDLGRLLRARQRGDRLGQLRERPAPQLRRDPRRRHPQAVLERLGLHRRGLHRDRPIGQHGQFRAGRPLRRQAAGPGRSSGSTNGGQTVINPWSILPGTNVGLLRGALYFDQAGDFGGDLMIATNTGKFFKVDAASGHATLIADVNTLIEGITTIPDDVAKYGPLAGKLVGGAEDEDGIWAVDPSGSTQFFSLPNVPGPESMNLIPANQNFFGVNFGTSEVLGAPGLEFTSMVGDILLTAEFTTATTGSCSTSTGTGPPWSRPRSRSRPTRHRAVVGKARRSRRPGSRGSTPSRSSPACPTSRSTSTRTTTATSTPAAPSTTTDATGNYSFTGLAPRTYDVAEVGLPGFAAQTAPKAGENDVTVASGAVVSGVDFGNTQLNVTPGPRTPPSAAPHRTRRRSASSTGTTWRSRTPMAPRWHSTSPPSRP